MYRTIPLSIRDIHATEAVLDRLHEAARLGLKDDSLAYAAGLLPEELRALQNNDPLVNRVIGLARADSEKAAAQTLHEAAVAGDAKMALEILRYQHDWVAKTHVQVDVTQTISITGALEQATQRVIEGVVVKEAISAPEQAPQTLENRRRHVKIDYDPQFAAPEPLDTAYDDADDDEDDD